MLILYTENDIIYKLHLLSFKKGRSHMKNAKKYLSLLLSFLLTFCCISLPANAEVYYNSLSDTPDIADTYDMPKTHNDDTTPIITKGKGGGNVEYELHENGVLYVYGSGEMYNYPNKEYESDTESYELVSDGQKDHFSNKSTKTDYHDYTEYYSPFYESPDIKTVIVEYGVTTIGEGFFSYCNNLSSVYFADSVTKINDSAFCDCISLKKIKLSDSLSLIGDFAFYKNIALENFIMPDNVTEICYKAFAYCGKLTSFYIPKNLQYFSETALQLCSNLEEIKVDPQNKYFQSIDSVLYNKDATKLIFCPAKKTSLVLPDTVTDIVGITENYEKELYCDAILGECTHIESITVGENNTVFSSYDGALYNKDKTTLILFPKSKGTADIYSGVELIGPCSFYDCDVIEKIVIPDNVKKIDRFAFASCDNLTEVHLNNDLNYIGWSAFSETKIESIDIPDSVKYINDDAFFACENLKNVKLPAELDFISCGLFEDCKSLEAIDIPDTVESIGWRAFNYCSSLKEVIIPDSVNYIDEQAFSHCSQLKNIKLSSNITQISGISFYGCSSLESIVIPKSVKTLYWNCFGDCENLKSIQLSQLTDIYYEAFSGCKNLKDVYFTGSKEQWNSIDIDEYLNDELLNANIHYHSRLNETFDEPDTDTDLYRIDFEFPNGKVDYEVWDTDQEKSIPIDSDSFVFENNRLVLCVPMPKNNFGRPSYTSIEIEVYGNFDEYYIGIDENSDYCIIVEGIRSNLKIVLYYSGETEEIVPYGDVNFDGKVTAKDSLAVQRYSIKLEQLSEYQFISADVDKDGKVNSKDALYILRCSINLAVLPVENDNE